MKSLTTKIPGLFIFLIVQFTEPFCTVQSVSPFIGEQNNYYICWFIIRNKSSFSLKIMSTAERPSNVNGVHSGHTSTKNWFPFSLIQFCWTNRLHSSLKKKTFYWTFLLNNQILQTIYIVSIYCVPIVSYVLSRMSRLL